MVSLLEKRGFLIIVARCLKQACRWGQKHSLKIVGTELHHQPIRPLEQISSLFSHWPEQLQLVHGQPGAAVQPASPTWPAVAGIQKGHQEQSAPSFKKLPC